MKKPSSELRVMTISYLLRPATFEDKEFMMGLEKTVFEQFPNVMELFDENRQKKQYETYFKPDYVFIIEYDSQQIGAASILFRRKDIFIMYLYVLPEFQDMGIDRTLIKRVLNRAKRELKPVLTCVFKDDIQAKKMCDGLGFEVFDEDNLRWRVKWMP